MKKWNIGVLSKDREYTERLLAYLRQSEFRGRLSAAWFTDTNHCRERFALDGAPDMLLADKDILLREGEEWLSGLDGRVLLLSEGSIGGSCGFPETEKYQPLNRLLDAVMEQASASLEAPAAGKFGEAESFVLAVYSAVGGAGKTVFSYVAAGLLARMGRCPLVITLESEPSLIWKGAAGEDEFGRALYEVTKTAGGPVPLIDRFLRYDSLRKVQLLPAAENAEDLEQMSRTDTMRLIEGAAASAKTDSIILDLDSSLHPRVLTALERSGKIVCLVPDNALGQAKTRQLVQKLERLLPGVKERISLIVNGCTESPTDLLHLGYGAEDALPFQQEWQHLARVEELHPATLYHERLNKWLASFMGDEGRSSKGVRKA